LLPGKLRNGAVEVEGVSNPYDDRLWRTVEALATRSRRRSVEHDHETPPCMNVGKHTSSDSPLLEVLSNHALNCEKPLKVCDFGGSDRGDDSAALPKTVSNKAGLARNAELAKTIRNGPDP